MQSLQQAIYSSQKIIPLLFYPHSFLPRIILNQISLREKEREREKVFGSQDWDVSSGTPTPAVATRRQQLSPLQHHSEHSPAGSLRGQRCCMQGVGVWCLGMGSLLRKAWMRQIWKSRKWGLRGEVEGCVVVWPKKRAWRSDEGRVFGYGEL